MPPLVGGELDDVVIKTGDVDAAVFVDHPAEQFAQRHGWILDRAAVNAGVQIAVGTGELDLERGDAAQRVRQRRVLEVGHACVGNHDAVALEFAFVLLEKLDERFAADLLLALYDERQVARQLGAGLEIRLDRLEMGEVLALVVAGAAREEVAAAKRRLERRAVPQLERLGRLNVVVAVHEKVRLGAVAPARRGGSDDRVAAGPVHARLEAKRLGVTGEPAGAVGHVFFVRALRRHAGEAQILDQLVDEPLPVGIDVFLQLIHEWESALGQAARAGWFPRSPDYAARAATATPPKSREGQVPPCPHFFE